MSGRGPGCSDELDDAPVIVLVDEVSHQEQDGRLDGEHDPRFHGDRPSIEQAVTVAGDQVSEGDGLSIRVAGARIEAVVESVEPVEPPEPVPDV